MSRNDTNPETYETFVQLFARNESRIRAFVYTMLPMAENTDEVMQETSLVLWRKFGEFEEGTHFLNWALTIARFEVLKYRRKQVRDRHVFDADLIRLLADEAAADTQRREQERRALDACIQKLAPRQREIVRAAYAEGVTIKGVAERLGRSATSLYKALNRIRIELLDCIDKTIAAEAQT